MYKTQIIKAEILWTRICPLQCSYCSMVDGRRNTVTLHDWKRGFDQLKKLGCSFGAFYGAEPLHDFDKLPEVIQYAESIGVNTTVITSGVVSDTSQKLKTLYEHGLRSITASYDAVSDDKSSAKKTSKALEVIETFRSFGTVRDSAIVVTLTKTNLTTLPSIVKEMSAKGIWTFFDLIHPDRSQPGSKVKDADYDLLFDKEDWSLLVKVLAEVQKMKEEGYLVHTSKVFFETIKIVAAYVYTWDKEIPFDKIQPYKLWNCAVPECFPSWVSVDCDGTVYPCDDFQPRNVTAIKIWEIADLWKEFSSIWKSHTNENCPGCLWNTHIDAHAIKQRAIPLTDYIHGLK